MDFAASIAFLVLYYIRPQEWIPGVELLRPVILVMGVALLGTFTRKSGFHFREVFKTPHDWLMLAYFLWIVGTTPNPFVALGGLYNLFVFYVVTVLALSNLERIRIYLWCWTGLFFTLAAMAVASEYGFDPMGSAEVTHGAMEGRLSLGTGNFCNPNALGHSVMPVLLMLYFLLVWERPLFACLPALPLVALPAYCIYLTFSKGAYLSGFVNGLFSLSFGLPRLVQIWILAGALSVGVVGLRQLPRMSTMDNTKGDEGIQRRAAAFHFGYSAMRHHPTGLGYEKFVEKMQPSAGRWTASPHSSYVHVGAEFGFPGLFLFCGLLYACYRTLLTARITSIREDRVRRVLFVLLLAYTVSSWMIDWATMAHFWLIVAAIAAFHRYLLEKEMAPPLEPATAEGIATTKAAMPSGPAPGIAPATLRPTFAPRNQNEPLTDETLVPFWNHLRLKDLGIIGGLTLLTAAFWRYVMMNV